MRNRGDKVQETISFDIQTANSSVMLSKALVLASLGFMRNNDGSKIAGKGFAFYLWFGSVVYWGTLCIKPNFFCQWPLRWFHIQSQHVREVWLGLFELALTFLPHMIKENGRNKLVFFFFKESTSPWVIRKATTAVELFKTKLGGAGFIIQ